MHDFFFFLFQKKKMGKQVRPIFQTHGRRRLYWLVCITGFLFGILCLLLFLYERHKYNRFESDCSDLFNIHHYLSFVSSTEDTFCVRLNGTHRTFCIHVDASKTITLTSMNEHILFTGTWEELAKDEMESSPVFTVGGSTILVFQYPFAKDTIAFRNLSDKTQSQRLCYCISQKLMYISPPTNQVLMSSDS